MLTRLIMQYPEVGRDAELGTPESISPNQTDLTKSLTTPAKKERQYFEPTKIQFAIALCLVAVAILASMELARLVGS
jgi:hypothetical protein